MTTAKPVDDPWQAILDRETGEYCATVGMAIGLLARIVSEPAGIAAPHSDRIAPIWAEVTS